VTKLGPWAARNECTEYAHCVVCTQLVFTSEYEYGIWGENPIFRGVFRIAIIVQGVVHIPHTFFGHAIDSIFRRVPQKVAG